MPRRVVAGALLSLSLLVSVVQLARGHYNCDPYDGGLAYFMSAPLPLIACALVLLLVHRPRTIGWPLGALLAAAFLSFFVAFTDLAGACAD